MERILNLDIHSSEEISLESAKQLCIFHNGETYTYFDEGCTRFVYVNVNSTKVLKLEKLKASTLFNEEENSIYENAQPEDKALMVETKLLSRGLIEQRYVTPIKFGGRKLNQEQKEFALSCRNEVGWDEHGNLLCYDLSDYKKY